MKFSALFVTLTALAAAEPPAPASPVFAQNLEGKLQTVQAIINAKLKEDSANGKSAMESEFTSELQTLEALRAAHAAEKSESIARLLMTEAALYASFLNHPEIVDKLYAEVIRDYPGTPAAQWAGTILLAQRQTAEAQVMRRQLVGQPVPNFEGMDLNNHVQTAAQYHGKVLLLHFWSTTCAPCIKALPDLEKIYAQHHHEGFEVLGAYYDTNRATVASYLRAHKVPWSEIFYSDIMRRQFRVATAPANYLIGRDGKVIALDLLDAGELERVVTRALGAK